MLMNNKSCIYVEVIKAVQIPAVLVLCWVLELHCKLTCLKGSLQLQHALLRFPDRMKRIPSLASAAL